MTTANGEELPKKLQLYSFFSSPPAFSVRIALNLKGLDYEYKAVNLSKREQIRPEFLKINPIGYVPALMDGDMVLADSFAIILAASIVCASIQPLIRIPIIKYIGHNVGLDEQIPWVNKHVGKGFAAQESY